MVHQNKKSMEVKAQSSKLKAQSYNLKLKTKIKPDVRYLYDMKSVLYDKKWLMTVENFPVYYIYRGVKEKNCLRYDITDITSRLLGREFPKTKGHEHPKGCQEFITVLEGKAIFLFQKSKGKRVLDVYQILAKKGDWVIAPAGYAHITINPGPEKLKIANWIDKKCRGIYDFIEKLQGACYYYTKSGWIKNKKYDIIPKLRTNQLFKRKLRFFEK